MASAVVLDYTNSIFESVNDSKKLSKIKREKLFELIISNAIDYSVSFIDNNMIDEINILKATMMAMSNAIKNIKIRMEIILK